MFILSLYYVAEKQCEREKGKKTEAGIDRETDKTEIQTN